MARQRYNLVTGALDGAHDDTTTTLTLATALAEGGGNISTIASPDYALLQIDDEIVSLTAYTSGATTGTMARGQKGTEAATHETNAAVTLVPDKDDPAACVLHGWFQDNVTASQSAVVLGLGNSRTEIPMPAPGHIVGVVVFTNAARAAGTLTVDVTIDGTVTGLTAVLNGSSTTTTATRQAQNTDKYTIGQRIGVKITTDSGWLPTTADIDVAVLVVSDGAA